MLARRRPPADFADVVRERLRASDAVGAKSIAAYRCGLGLPRPEPDRGRAATAPLAGGRPDPVGGPGGERWLAWTAVEVGLPLQVHVAYGDSDLDLADCDPLRLTAFLRATQDRGVPVLLLHNYPFHRNAAYLGQVFDHVYMDVGLATHNTGALSASLMREALELVPFGKLLFSTDAYGLAELYLLGSDALPARADAGPRRAGRRRRAARPDADRVARLVGHENARRVYRLGSST